VTAPVAMHGGQPPRACTFAFAVSYLAFADASQPSSSNGCASKAASAARMWQRRIARASAPRLLAMASSQRRVGLSGGAKPVSSAAARVVDVVTTIVVVVLVVVVTAVWQLTPVSPAPPRAPGRGS